VKHACNGWQANRQEYLAEKFPAIKLVALSMKDDDDTIISMIRSRLLALIF
jgi:DNA-binding NarL/FixJ family response regulator